MYKLLTKINAIWLSYCRLTLKCNFNVIIWHACLDDCGSMRGVPVSVVLSGCGRKTFSEVSRHSNKSGSRFNNYPPYSSRQRALVRETRQAFVSLILKFFSLLRKIIIYCGINAIFRSARRVRPTAITMSIRPWSDRSTTTTVTVETMHRQTWLDQRTSQKLKLRKPFWNLCRQKRFYDFTR